MPLAAPVAAGHKIARADIAQGNNVLPDVKTCSRADSSGRRIAADAIADMHQQVEITPDGSGRLQEIPIKSFAVSVVVVRATGTGHEILLLRRMTSLAGEWCQIAGKIGPGETAWQAALRETKEETGLVLEAIYSADICEQFYEADRNAIILVPVFVGFVDEDATIQLNDEHSEFAWVSYSEALTMVPFAAQRHVLRQVWAEFIEREPSRWLLIDHTSRA